MSRRIKFHQPLKNITASLNSNMSFHQHSDSGLYSLNNSPMSALAFNLSELSTERNTPRLRRRLSLSSIDTPTNDGGKLDSGSTFSAESGCFSESPLENSPTFDSLNMKRYATAFHPDIPLEAFSVKKKTIAFRRINSQPLPAMRGLDSPTDFLEDVKEDSGDNDSADVRNENIPNDDEPSLAGNFRNKLNSEDAISQDSGLGSDQDMRSSVSSFDSLISSSSLTHYDRLPSLEDVWNSMDSPSFKTPKGMPPKRHHSVTEDAHYSEETCSPIKYSPVKSSSMPKPSFSKDLFHLQEDSNEVTDEQKAEADDGFQELFKLNDENGVLEDRVSSLVSHTLLLEHPRVGALGMSTKDVRTCATKPAVCSNNSVSSSHPFVVRRSLYRSQSLDIRSRPSSKRCEPPADDNTPVQCKRWRGEVTAIKEKTVDEEDSNNKSAQVTRFQRSHSEVETIKYAVSLMLAEPDLIGDCSKAYCLPTVSGKHQDLKSITPQTLSQLMANEFSVVVEEFHIIDCRYPYEYEGGHIQNAINIYTKDAVVAKYLKSPLSVKDTNKRIILVFHCEFSSERGPGLFRFLRGKDRETNKEFYPFLHYPEIYLLEGGYKSFFESYSHLCEPRNYKTMHDKNHCEDLRKFRAKSKTWSDDKMQSRPGVRNLKF